jgi:cell division protease FtsH
MSDRLGPVAYHNGEDHPFLGREIAQHERHFSEHTAQVIDEEVEKILHAAEDLSKRTIDAHSDKLSTLAEALLEREVVDDKEIADLIGPSVNESRERSVTVGPSEVVPAGE